MCSTFSFTMYPETNVMSRYPNEKLFQCVEDRIIISDKTKVLSVDVFVVSHDKIQWQVILATRYDY